MTLTIEELREQRPTFEEVQGRLEEVIRLLEEGHPELERALDRFEEGMVLAAYAQEILERARRRVELIVEGAQGPERRPFDTGGDAEGGQHASSSADHGPDTARGGEWGPPP